MHRLIRAGTRPLLASASAPATATATATASSTASVAARRAVTASTVSAPARTAAAARHLAASAAPQPTPAAPAPSATSAAHVPFPHGPTRITTDLNEAMHPPENRREYPALRILDESGDVRPGAEKYLEDPMIANKDFVRRLYTTMVRLEEMDRVFYDAQRQGRISFYMTSRGEEGAMVGAGAGLSDDDVCFAQYRESGVLMWRGFTLQNFADELYKNEGDASKGRTMPMHYGSVGLNWQTISSPLGTHIPQATGVAYAFKMSGENRAACVFFGEGAASEGDFAVSLNIAATTEVPTLFFCRNNGYAISTRVNEQYRGDGVVARGEAYGVHAIRFDGTDVLASYLATREARRIAVTESKPVLLESMAYRCGHHSTSDDSSRYREQDEIESWRVDRCPIKRLRGFMEHPDREWWDAEREQSLRKTERTRVINAMRNAEAKGKPELDTLFTDVYKEVPWHIEEQRQMIHAHVEKYKDEYQLLGRTLSLSLQSILLRRRFQDGEGKRKSFYNM